MISASAPDSASQPLRALLDGIDHGIESHLAWNQRLLRCTLLRESPGDAVLRPDAHLRCRFGRWFSDQRPLLDGFDAVLVQRIAQAHRDMHDVVRRLCEQVLRAEPATPADLQAYEQGQSTMVSLLNTLRERVARAATQHDVLTGLPLRHGLEYAFDLRRKDVRRAEASLWLAMIDVDRFKAVNDTHGHAVGDQALKHLARCMVAGMRESDALFRFGGEEFLALFMVREPPGIQLLAARLLDAVASAPLALASGASLQLGITIGLARVRADEDLAAATERADHALLLGKAQGRNRFVLAPD